MMMICGHKRSVFRILLLCCVLMFVTHIIHIWENGYLSRKPHQTKPHTNYEGFEEIFGDDSDIVEGSYVFYDAHAYDTDIDKNSTLTTVSAAGENINKPILTLFTTLRESAAREDIHRKTFNNWAALSPGVKPLLYVPATDAQDRNTYSAPTGWTTRPITKLRHGIPVLKHMFMDALQDAQTPFVGFANADILFDGSLDRTLRNIHDVISRVSSRFVLITGRRRNANITLFNFGDGSNIQLVSEVATRVRLFRQDAQDYFIVSKRGLNWQKVPDFVVGRVGYDNWFVVKALDWNITFIDASYSVIAVHQVGADGIFAGFTSNPGQINLNKDLVQGFNYGTGVTGCAPLMSVYGAPGEDPIIARPIITHPANSQTNKTSQTTCHPRVVVRKTRPHHCSVRDRSLSIRRGGWINIGEIKSLFSKIWGRSQTL